MSSFWFALNSCGGLGLEQLGCRAQARRDIGDHRLDAVGEQLVLLVGVAELRSTERGGRAEVADGLAETAQSRAVEHACPPSGRTTYAASVAGIRALANCFA